jgi:alkanesulfonate monooxygenase SsuD/methylene tetrahydromethanopterin reductase-like flavin-dependent oxidoreductase (luciferase family)
VPRFGLVLPIQAAGLGLDVLLSDLGEEVLAAERAGFDAVLEPEFHQAHGGALVSPLLVLAWLGARTTRIRLGTMVLAGPLHDPVRLAEDATMLDWATRGRVIVGLGTAHVPPDFELFGVERAARQAILDEVLDVMDLCFSGEPFDYAGRHFQRRGQITPPPFTAPRPPVWIGAHGPRGLRRAGERADAWVCDPQRDVDTAAALARVYGSAAREAGRTPRTREDFTLDPVAPGRFLYGTPEDVRTTARDWFERTGADYMAVRLRQPGGPTHAEATVAIERFGREVIGPLA